MGRTRTLTASVVIVNQTSEDSDAISMAAVTALKMRSWQKLSARIAST